MGEADEFVTSFMIADTVVSDSPGESASISAALAEFTGPVVDLRSCGCPTLRFTERCVVPSGDAGLVACVGRALRGALAGGELKLCIGVPGGVATSSSAADAVARVRAERSVVGCVFLDARVVALDAWENRSMPWKSEPTLCAMVCSETLTLRRVTT